MKPAILVTYGLMCLSILSHADELDPNATVSYFKQQIHAKTTNSEAPHAPFPRVDSDLADFDKTVAKMQDEFAQIPSDPHDKDWVKQKLQRMFDVDQFWRKADIPFQHKYSKDETEYGRKQFVSRFQAIDAANTNDLKELLKIYGWFKISEFGKSSDQNAWLLVQHADQDVAFQKEVLQKLEALHPEAETSPKNYAYLFDRVASNEKRPQRYGTQGRCVGPGKWEPHTIENPDRVEELRKAVGLDPLEAYKKRFIDTCH